MSLGKDDDIEQLDRLKEEIRAADAIVVGAGAGLSTSAGFTHTKPRKSSGHIGQGISTSTDTLMHLKIHIQNFITLLRIKITL